MRIHCKMHTLHTAQLPLYEHKTNIYYLSSRPHFGASWTPQGYEMNKTNDQAFRWRTRQL